MNKYWIILGSLLVLAFYACSKEEEEDMIDRMAREKLEIKAYLHQNVTTTIQAVPYYSQRGGLLIDSIFIFNADGNGEVVQDTGWVLMDYTQKTLDGRIVDSTFPEERDSLWGTYPLGGPIYHRVDTVHKFNYFAEAFKYIGAGTTGGEMIVPSSLGKQDGITQFFRLKSYKVFKDIGVNEDHLIQQYLESIQGKTLESYQDTMKGSTTYTVITKQGGKQDTIGTGDSVLMAVEGFILDDARLQDMSLRQFEENGGYQLYFTERWQKTAPVGYVAGLKRLKEGDEAEIIIPYGMAYGAAGFTREVGPKENRKKQYVIPPYATLLYRVKFLKIISHPEK